MVVAYGKDIEDKAGRENKPGHADGISAKRKTRIPGLPTGGVSADRPSDLQVSVKSAVGQLGSIMVD
jgi:hypothetical protein